MQVVQVLWYRPYKVTEAYTLLVQGEHWGDGTVFRPERFIDEEGRLSRDEHFIPFSVGKRVRAIHYPGSCIQK